MSRWVVRSVVIIAISGKSGCGNTTFSATLAQRLSLQVINYTFRDYAKEHGMSFAEVHRRAEQDPSIDNAVDDRQVELAKQGNCVIASRLAIWKIAQADIKIFLYAPLLIRAQRIRQREDGNYIGAVAATLMRDVRNRIRYKKIYGIDLNNYKPIVDAVVNTSHHTADELCDRFISRINGGGVASDR